MRLGSGVAPVLALLKSGVSIGLAVDGSASNDASNMLLDIRGALFIQRLIHGPTALKVKDVFRMATEGSARCLGREDIGTLKPGKAADIALFDLNELNYSGAGDPLAALALCAPTAVHTLIVNGRVLMKDHELQSSIDLKRLVAKHRKKAQGLWKR
jgi:cytosine/adenosine deaminase-related metal-dependent hydrolase